MLNFSNFKTVSTSNTREGGNAFHKGQSFNFKYKKSHSNKKGVQAIESQFTVSNKLFDELGLQEKALIQVVSPDGVSYLAVVDNENGVFLKTTKKNEGGIKGKGFKSTILEDALGKQGVINLDQVGQMQKLDLNLVGTDVEVGGIKAYSVYEVAKAVDSALTEDEKAEDEAENSTESATQDEEVAPDAQAAETTSAPSVEDDF